LDRGGKLFQGPAASMPLALTNGRGRRGRASPRKLQRSPPRAGQRRSPKLLSASGDGSPGRDHSQQVELIMIRRNDIDQHRLDALLGRIVGDLGGAWNAALTVIGDQLGLYRALAAEGALSPEALAEKTGTKPRYVREWLCA